MSAESHLDLGEHTQAQSQPPGRQSQRWRGYFDFASPVWCHKPGRDYDCRASLNFEFPTYADLTSAGNWIEVGSELLTGQLEFL